MGKIRREKGEEDEGRNRLERVKRNWTGGENRARRETRREIEGKEKKEQGSWGK